MALHPLGLDGVRAGAHDTVAAVEARLEPRDTLAPVVAAGAGHEFGRRLAGRDIVGLGSDGVGARERQGGEEEDGGETHVGGVFGFGAG